MTTLYAWHFLPSDGRLRWGSQEVVTVGRTYSATGPLVLCQNGMHASVRARDALRYAPGPVVCRVKLSGERLTDTNKHAARHRTVLWLADASNVLYEFALNVAEEALSLVSARGWPVDPRSLQALTVKRRWLHGAVSDAHLSAAWGAAWSEAWRVRSAAERATRGEAWYTAGRAAWGAAWNAARSAAWRAAWGAADRAAESAAWGASESAAWGAAWGATRRMAESAAWGAAWRAAESAQNIALETMLNRLSS